jgi:hypothetical protein
MWHPPHSHPRRCLLTVDRQESEFPRHFPELRKNEVRLAASGRYLCAAVFPLADQTPGTFHGLLDLTDIL